MYLIPFGTLTWRQFQILLMTFLLLLYKVICLSTVHCDISHLHHLMFPEVIRSFMSFNNQTLGQPACVQVALLRPQISSLYPQPLSAISITSLINMIAILLQTGLLTRILSPSWVLTRKQSAYSFSRSEVIFDFSSVIVHKPTFSLVLLLAGPRRLSLTADVSISLALTKMMVFLTG